MYTKVNELTVQRRFIESFVQEIVFGPGQARACHTIPMSLDGGIAGTDAEEFVTKRR